MSNTYYVDTGFEIGGAVGSDVELAVKQPVIEVEIDIQLEDFDKTIEIEIDVE